MRRATLLEVLSGFASQRKRTVGLRFWDLIFNNSYVRCAIRCHTLTNIMHANKNADVKLKSQQSLIGESTVLDSAPVAMHQVPKRTQCSWAVTGARNVIDYITSISTD